MKKYGISPLSRVLPQWASLRAIEAQAKLERTQREKVMTKKKVRDQGSALDRMKREKAAQLEEIRLEEAGERAAAGSKTERELAAHRVESVGIADPRTRTVSPAAAGSNADGGARSTPTSAPDPGEGDHPVTPSPPHPVTPEAAAAEGSRRIREHYARQTVQIEVPLGPRPGEAEAQIRHVDVQLRTARQRETMRRLFTGLDLAGTRTADGRRVTNNVQALLWLLEQVAGGDRD